ncbi:hypothetical protein BT96DRAFT_936129 [Gymnopus androsaceus JB14]|uniref:Muskelin N-terminal domain-containing protein n=1 Tax=Gymnopus androsaceus JB14 TaxID=1447944 RepID=A0A6A4I547_9AGAR|nr:hypothetical protein BT96DRAFT_936129 [Gymnopus androsaceus JB14]
MHYYREQLEAIEQESTNSIQAIHGCSSYSTHFYPENILVDDPSDSKNRWTTQQSEASHWILLRLEQLAVLKSITFGKFHTTHPCNMKEFKVYVGLTPENMTEVLNASLKNDAIKETFSIRHLNSTGHSFPTRFVKVEPISVHGQSFNTSIWHISMNGIINEESVEEVKKDYDQFREKRVMQHILKHLRQRRLLTPYNSILSQSSVQLEHPLVTQLYESIVLTGDWDRAEKLLRDISVAGPLIPAPLGEQIHDTDLNGEIPSARGGHAMCIDSQRGLIYLFGGWDGQKSLDDFWLYDIKERRWTVLSPNTSLDAYAPGPRSCHKMVYDSKTNAIYVLGKLGELENNPVGGTGSIGRTHRSSTGADETPTLSSRAMSSSEFYRYHCETNKWERLAIDVNGPRTIFDHQMAIDSEAQILYVFGGRAAEKDFEFSGTSDNVIPSRFGHSMILEPHTRQLYIFAGEREEKFLSDMHIYDIATNTTTEVFSDFTSSGGPQPCFTQRAVADFELQEIYVFSGLIRDRRSASESSAALSDSSHWLYRYQFSPGKWERIVSLEEERRKKMSSAPPFPPHSGGTSPSSRFAHQVVYEPNSKTVYLHGGTTGMAPAKRKESSDAQSEEVPMRRLSDFWKMSLLRPTSDELIRRSAYLIRQQRFKEMCDSQPAVQSLVYLQNQVSEVVDHGDLNEEQLFRSLLTHLLMHSSPVSVSPTSPSPKDTSGHSTETSDDSSSPIKVDLPELLESIPDDTIDHVSSTPPLTANSESLGGIFKQDLEDPFERKYRPAGEALSQECFVQRTKTFEAILEFIADHAKQPAGSLLDLVDIDVEVS